ncbi:MAG: c-type cytochrome [Halieaceae bacterium]
MKVTKSLKVLGITVFCALLSGAVLGQTEAQREAIAERIKPHGDVCLKGDNSCGGAAVASAAGRSGEDVYNSACMACHMTGAAGAPKLGDAAAWADRIARGNDALYDAGINGVAGTGMIAKGGCMSCSDDEVIAAVDYMVDNSQ